MGICLVSYATERYKDIYESKLKPSAGKYWRGAVSHISVTDKYTWLKATQLKPQIILDALIEHDTVLYLDSDAVIQDERINDIAGVVGDSPLACVFLKRAHWYYNISDTLIEPLTGTLYFTREAIPFVRKWAEESVKGNKPDGEVFADCLLNTDIAAFQLPLKWAYIKDLPDGRKGGIPCHDPIVVHHQASRTRRHND